MSQPEPGTTVYRQFNRDSSSLALYSDAQLIEMSRGVVIERGGELFVVNTQLPHRDYDQTRTFMEVWSPEIWFSTLKEALEASIEKKTEQIENDQERLQKWQEMLERMP